MQLFGDVAEIVQRLRAGPGPLSEHRQRLTKTLRRLGEMLFRQIHVAYGTHRNECRAPFERRSRMPGVSEKPPGATTRRRRAKWIFAGTSGTVPGVPENSGAPREHESS